jgi:Fic-DOC domain mobile mystery protein B
VSDFLFKDRDGQTPLPHELQKGLKIKTIQTVGELDEYEEDNIAKGLSWLAKQKANPCKYDFWLKLHKKLFENVWTWAGKIRTHELANPDFKDPHEIWPELYQLEKDLDFWITAKSFSSQDLAARFHERIETIHPFANGNGRFGRIITEQICRFHQYEIPTWGRKLQSDPAKRRAAYIAALTQARRTGDYSDLVTMMFS